MGEQDVRLAQLMSPRRDLSNTPAIPQRWRRPFFSIWTGQAMSLAGSSLAQFALVWWLTQVTGSATVLASAAFAGLLPNVVLGPFAGALVDRWDRRKVMIAADGLTALTTVGLICVFISGAVQVWYVYIALFLRGLGSAFHWPAMQASTSLMVPQDQLARVAGLNQALRGVADIAAPSVGAFVLSVAPLYAALAVDVCTASIAIVQLWFVPIPRACRATAHWRTAFKWVWRDVAGGISYLRAWKGAGVVLCLVALVDFLVTPVGVLVPLLVTQQLKGSVWHLGMVQSGFGVGIVIGGLVLGVWGGFRRRMLTGVAGLIGLGAGILLAGLSPVAGFVWMIAGMFVSGFMLAIASGAMFALLQARVTVEVQGRVFTLLQSIVAAMAPVSMLAAGPVAEQWGVRAWFVLGGGACLVAGVLGLCVPAVGRIEESHASPSS